MSEEYCKSEEGFCFACCIRPEGLANPELSDLLKEKTELFLSMNDKKEYVHSAELSFPGCAYLGFISDDFIGCMIYPTEENSLEGIDPRNEAGYDCCINAVCPSLDKFKHRSLEAQEKILLERQSRSALEITRRESE